MNDWYDDITIMWIALFRSLFHREYQVQQLIADLVDDDLIVASEAAEDLGNIGHSMAVRPLLLLLEMTEADIVELEAEAELDGDDFDPFELTATIDLRQDVVRALGKIGDANAVPALIGVLYMDTDKGIQREAITALQCIGTVDALAAVASWKSQSD